MRYDLELRWRRPLGGLPRVGRRLAVVGLGLAAAFWLLSASPAWADDGDGPVALRPPCGAAASPDYAAVDAPPTVAIWRGQAGLGGDIPVGCIPWSLDRSSVVIAVAGRFGHAGPVEELLDRFGAISALRTVRYWSVSDRRWEPLVRRAHALAGPDSNAPRADFAAAELRTGADLYFLQEENRTSAATYRLRVTAASEDRLTVELENVTPVRRLMVPLIASGDFHSIWFLDRLGPGVWGYYSVVGSAGAMDFAASPKSAINRAVAMFRHLAGIPTDREPPPAP